MDLEKEIAANAVAPRVSDQDIENMIIGEVYRTADKLLPPDDTPPYGEMIRRQLGLTTICVLVLRNGWTSVGISSVVSPENFNSVIGCKVARQKAKDNLWPVMGYALLDRIHRDKMSEQEVLAAHAQQVGKPPLADFNKLPDAVDSRQSGEVSSAHGEEATETGQGQEADVQQAPARD